MRSFKKSAHNLITLTFIIVLSFSIFSPGLIYARSAQEIEAEKSAKQKELDTLNSDLKKAEQALKTNVARRSSSLSEIEKIKAELAEIESQLEVNKLKKQQLEQEIGIKTLEKEQREKEQNVQIATSYITWKTQEESMIVFSSDDVLKSAIYYEFVTESSKDSILGLNSQLQQLNKSNLEFQAQIDKLATDNVTLSDRKTALEKQITQFNTNIVTARSNVEGLRSKVVGVQQQVDFLTNEQRSIQNTERDILQGAATTCNNRLPLEPGTFYFNSRGRDLYQGHGVGMSQFGAFGAATKGWGANQILTFYYAQTVIQNRPGLTVNVSGHGSMSADAYVAGLGEVPSKACGTAEQAEQNPNKYVAGTAATNNWTCWPEEAIKAQVIAARSYGVTSSQPICTTAACQVYVGGNNKQWAADETSNMYVVSVGATRNNQIINALYSSDNSQGFGTANNDTVFSNFEGVGTPYSYLRHVNDASISVSGGWRDWTCRTNGYTMDQLNQFFEYARGYGSAATFMNNLKNSVGTVTNLTFEKDQSQRVKVVYVNGTNGTKPMAGWLFKAAWNSWVNNSKPSGQDDYIYSLTWTFQQQP
jgi:SpoIID/LytB domain protein